MTSRLENARIPYEACPLCDGRRLSLARRADCSRHALYDPRLPAAIDWLRCGDCAHVFTSGHFTDEALKIVFSRVQTNQQVGYDLERQRHVSAHMVAKVARYRNEGAWLDVGFGNGALLLTAAEWGYQPVGLDLRSQNVEALRAAGCEAHVSSIERFETATRFGVISMADVLEHMPFPTSAVAAAQRLLAPGGILFVSMPAFDSPIWRALDANTSNPYWGELEHYHNFSRERLRALLAGHGFRMLEYGVSERYRACMELIFERAPSD